MVDTKKERIEKGIARMKKPEKPTGILKHISIRPAENGVSVEVQRGDGPGATNVFAGRTAKEDALAHIERHL